MAHCVSASFESAASRSEPSAPNRTHRSRSTATVVSQIHWFSLPGSDRADPNLMAGSGKTTIAARVTSGEPHIRGVCLLVGHPAAQPHRLSIVLHRDMGVTDIPCPCVYPTSNVRVVDSTPLRLPGPRRSSERGGNRGMAMEDVVPLLLNPQTGPQQVIRQSRPCRSVRRSRVVSSARVITSDASVTPSPSSTVSTRCRTPPGLPRPMCCRDVEAISA